LTQTWPAGQEEPASVTVHGDTQWVSTQTAPPRHDETPLPVHGAGFTAQTPREKLHAKPAGHETPDEQCGTQTPLTQASPETTHCDPSEQSCACGAQRPSTQNDPTEQSPSALQATGAEPASDASPPAVASTTTSGETTSPLDETSGGAPSSDHGPSPTLVSGPSGDAAVSAALPSPASNVGVVESSVAPASSVAEASDTHVATPPETLQIWPPGHPVTEQSDVGDVLATHWPPLHAMPPPQSVSLLHAHGTQRLEYDGSGQS
jgi:hypothetical protein